MSLKITVLTGTNRPSSNSRKVSLFIADCYRSLGVDVWDLDLQNLPATVFAAESYAEKPVAFKPLAEKVLNCDGLVVVTPEYNGSFPGILKYFIDMLPFPESFEHRPVAFVGLAAGMWGALRAVEQLQQIFLYRNGLICPSRVFLPKIGSLLDKQGKLNDTDIQQRLQNQAADFVEYVKRMKGYTGGV
jgi:chromate reductase